MAESILSNGALALSNNLRHALGAISSNLWLPLSAPARIKDFQAVLSIVNYFMDCDINFVKDDLKSFLEGLKELRENAIDTSDKHRRTTGGRFIHPQVFGLLVQTEEVPCVTRSPFFCCLSIDIYCSLRWHAIGCGADVTPIQL